MMISYIGLRKTNFLNIEKDGEIGLRNVPARNGNKLKELGNKVTLLA
jgi:hypothetical protein